MAFKSEQIPPDSHILVRSVTTPYPQQNTGYSHIRMPAFPGPEFYCRV